MNELQTVVDNVRGQLAHMATAGSYTVSLDRDEAQRLVDAAQLQERCLLLGRALTALWSLVSEEDQRAIMALPHADKLLQVIERRGAINVPEVQP